MIYNKEQTTMIMHDHDHDNNTNNDNNNNTSNNNNNNNTQKEFIRASGKETPQRQLVMN